MRLRNPQHPVSVEPRPAHDSPTWKEELWPGLRVREDGVVVRSEDALELVTTLERQVTEAHPDLSESCREDILAMAKEGLEAR